MLGIVAAVIIVSLVGYTLYNVQPHEKKALIIDGLSIEFNNPDLIKGLREILHSRGYTVDVVNGTDVTLDAYKRMFDGGYNLIIIRVHSAPGEGVLVPKSSVVFFTSERTSVDKYFAEQVAGYVVKAKTLTRRESFYAITPAFIRSTPGSLDGAVVIGMIGEDMPKAFIYKGASVYIGWNGYVTPSYMDEAGLALVKHLVIDGYTVSEAVESIMQEYGPDPYHGSELEYYPLNKGDLRLS